MITKMLTKLVRVAMHETKAQLEKLIPISAHKFEYNSVAHSHVKPNSTILQTVLEVAQEALYMAVDCHYC